MIAVLILCSVVSCLQVTLVHHFAFLNAKPELPLILTIYLAIKKENAYGYGFLVGLFEDIFAITPFGTNMFLKGITGYLASLISINIYQNNVFTQIILAGCASVLDFLLFIVFGNMVFPSFRLTKAISISIFVGVIYTAVVCPLFFKLFDLYFEKTLVLKRQMIKWKESVQKSI